MPMTGMQKKPTEWDDDTLGRRGYSLLQGELVQGYWEGQLGSWKRLGWVSIRLRHPIVATLGEASVGSRLSSHGTQHR